MCLPVAVPAHPRILAGRRFLRISPDISPDISRNISGKRGVAGFPEIRFYLHKEFRDREIRLYLHKKFRAAELGGDASENGDFLQDRPHLFFV